MKREKKKKRGNPRRTSHEEANMLYRLDVIEVHIRCFGGTYEIFARKKWNFEFQPRHFKHYFLRGWFFFRLVSDFCVFCFVLLLLYFSFFVSPSLDLYFKIYAGSEQMEVLCSVFSLFFFFNIRRRHGPFCGCRTATKKVQGNEFFSPEHEYR